MHTIRRSRTVLLGLAVVAASGALALSTRIDRDGQSIPARLDDSEFWGLITELSEPGGYFHSDNFVSNEAALQYVIPDLLAQVGSGGVYVGVGPDQNFTYAVALRPRIAFIVDIRRQNMLQHLMYKALIEMSSDRAGFLSRLFSRPRPPAMDTSWSAAAMFDAYSLVAPDSALYDDTLLEVIDHLQQRHRFPLNDEDIAGIEYVFSAFFNAGPHLTYSFGQGRSAFGGMGMPTYAYLQQETDGRGTQRSYMASEENFATLKDLQTRNLIVPVVGNFAGDKALRAVGRYVRDRDAEVSVFYTSNVEQYLFQQGDDWSRFYANVATMPVGPTSTFVRSVSNRRWIVSQNPNSRSAQMVSSIAEVVHAFQSGRLQTYFELISLSR